MPAVPHTTAPNAVPNFVANPTQLSGFSVVPVTIGPIVLAMDAVTVSRTVNRNLALTLVMDNVTVSRVVNRAIALQLTLTPTVSRVVNRILAFQLTLSPTVVRTVNRILALQLTVTPTVSRVVNRVIGPIALTLTPTVSRIVLRVLSLVLDMGVSESGGGGGETFNPNVQGKHHY